MEGSNLCLTCIPFIYDCIVPYMGEFGDLLVGIAAIITGCRGVSE